MLVRWKLSYDISMTIAFYLKKKKTFFCVNVRWKQRYIKFYKMLNVSKLNWMKIEYRE